MSTYPQEPPAAYHNGVDHDYEKNPVYDDKSGSPVGSGHGGEYGDIQTGETNQLHKSLKSRHMQMIAIGGAIGAGLFVGSGGPLSKGGPGSLVLSFIIIGFFLLLTMQALAEMAVLYPVNGAFFIYICRFVERSWGFACGWDYAISWLTVLPFELTAAGLTISFWRSDINIGVWITVFLVVLSAIQVFGVRGYGEVEFILSTIKILACTGFIILGIVIDTGGVSTDDRGYIGGRYWHSPYSAFKNGFHGFCANFVNAAFAFGGTELTGLAAAEAANPLKAIPKATKQVFWRIAVFYVLNLLMVGLIVPADNEDLLGASNSNTKASPFVLAITLAGIKGLPSVMNAVITISVISVANSCTFGSTRTIQALAGEGMAPKFLAYIDKHGRPIWCCVLQIAFGFLAFANEADEGGAQFFNWLLALSGLAYFFIWGSICLAHIRFRAGWAAHGRSVDEIPYKAPFGVYGSYVACVLCCMCLMATFYVALYPVGGPYLDAESFFQQYLTAPIIIALYLGWKIKTRDTTFFIRAKDMDILTGLRTNLAELQEERARRLADTPPGWKGKAMDVVHALF